MNDFDGYTEDDYINDEELREPILLPKPGTPGAVVLSNINLVEETVYRISSRIQDIARAIDHLLLVNSPATTGVTPVADYEEESQALINERYVLVDYNVKALIEELQTLRTAEHAISHAQHEIQRLGG